MFLTVSRDIYQTSIFITKILIIISLNLRYLDIQGKNEQKNRACRALVPILNVKIIIELFLFYFLKITTKNTTRIFVLYAVYALSRIYLYITMFQL